MNSEQRRGYAKTSGGIPSILVAPGVAAALGPAALMWARMNPIKAMIAGDATVGTVTGMPTGNMMPTFSATYKTTQNPSGSYTLTTTIQSATGPIQASAIIAMEEGKVVISGLTSMSGGRGALGVGAVKQWLTGMQQAALKLFPDAMEGEMQYSREWWGTSKNPGPRTVPFTRKQ